MENRVLVLPHLGAGVAHFAFYPKSVIRACLDFVLLEEWILFDF